MAHTKMVPVRLSVIAEKDIQALKAGAGAFEQREIKVRRIAVEAHAQGGVLSELDLAMLCGYTGSGVCATVVRMRKRGEILPIRGYVADMGSWPTHKAAIIRLYLQGLTTPEIASRTYHTKRSVDRYIDAFERVRLLAAKHPHEELPLLTGLAPRVVAQYLAILEEHQVGRPLYPPSRPHRHA
jgi:Protein of unknown function (DUF1670)